MKTNLLKKIPWKTVFKIGGATAIGVSSIMSAFDTDKNTQELVKKLASKASTLGKQKS